ncbi:FAD-dependent oxidoreductase [Microbacterium luteolum]
MPQNSTVPKILIVGGGYAGFYSAWKLEKHLRKGEAEVTMVDPLPYMTYQPFLPEVAAGSIEARHSVVAHRRHLKRTNVITAKVTNINHAEKTATITPPLGESYEFAYDQIVVTAGAVSRTFPIPGIADNAIGLKTIEEAVAIRDRLMSNFDKAASLPAGPARDRLLTVVVVGGGFAGIEVFAELRSLASSLVSKYPQLTFDDTHFHLIEAMGRIMPEVSLKTSEWVLKDLAKRGANVHLDTQLTSAVDGDVELSTGEVIPTDLIVWTAGVMANPTVVRGGDLPVEERGRIQTRADLRVGTPEAFVEGAWAAGDVSAVPDLSGGGVGGFCVPNAQHAVRQAKLLAKNIVAVLRGEKPREYFHKNMGAVAGLGLYNGVFQSGKIALKGFVAWVAHRGYHGLAMPTWERKFRVVWGWWNNLWLGRDLVNLETVQNPRYVFEEFAARPRAAAPAAPAVPASPSSDAATTTAAVAGKVPDDKAPVDAAPAEKAPAAKKAPAKKAPAKKPVAEKVAVK